VAQISIVVKLTAQPGKRDELASVMKELTDNAESEPGTVHYILSADNKEDDVLWMWELYRDEAAVEAHSGSEVFKAFGPKAAHLFAGRPELHRCTPLQGKGL
jgi:quinol monooxygenase YgiN